MEVLLDDFVHLDRFYIFIIIKIPMQVILRLVINMNETKNRLRNFNSISEEVRYISNSVIRLKILATLHEKPQTMKEVTVNTGLHYSSVSRYLRDLELGGYVYKDENKNYILSNTLKVQIQHIIELKTVFDIMNNFCNILDKHIINMIPTESVADLYLLGKASLLESDEVDAFKTSSYIENALEHANKVKCVLPFYYESFILKLNDLDENNVPVDVFAHERIKELMSPAAEFRKLTYFKKDYNFLLIVTDKKMILGFYKEDGYFDQNRLLVSVNKDCLKWANSLFKTFKKKNK